jgi:hypothetical protein
MWPGCHQTLHPPASASQVLGLQSYTTMPGLFVEMEMACLCGLLALIRVWLTWADTIPPWEGQLVCHSLAQRTKTLAARWCCTGWESEDTTRGLTEVIKMDANPAWVLDQDTVRHRGHGEKMASAGHRQRLWEEQGLRRNQPCDTLTLDSSLQDRESKCLLLMLPGPWCSVAAAPEDGSKTSGHLSRAKYISQRHIPCSLAAPVCSSGHLPRVPAGGVSHPQGSGSLQFSILKEAVSQSKSGPSPPQASSLHHGLCSARWSSYLSKEKGFLRATLADRNTIKATQAI